MNKRLATNHGEAAVAPNEKVRVLSQSLSVGKVLRAAKSAIYRAGVVFDQPGGRRLAVVPVELQEKTGDHWQRLVEGALNDPTSHRVKQIGLDLAHANFGGELSASKVNLLPHQILLVYDLVATTGRRVLIADEVGLGKTIETGMLLRELHARGEADCILIVAPAGWVKNWQNELRNCCRMQFSHGFDDCTDYNAASWETHSWVIAPIDTLKQPRRIQPLPAASPWDVIDFNETHHLSRT